MREELGIRSLAEEQGERVGTFIVASVILASHELVVNIGREFLELLTSQAGELLASS